MCGRFALATDTEELEREEPGFESKIDITPRYNIAPTQTVAAALSESPGTIVGVKWGLTPSWSKDEAPNPKLINARAETLFEKPSFRSAISKRRCLIFATGFYEWKTEPSLKRKTPYYIRLREGNILTFGGIYETKRLSNGEFLCTAAIITTEPNEFMAALHNRMPLIIRKDERLEWLECSPERAKELLLPIGSDMMEGRPVDALVNNPANDEPACIAGL
ncbi:MAG: SOS response-associated peptidase [Chloroflexota bacterium]